MKTQHSLFNKIIDNIVVSSIEENFIQEGRFGNGIFGGGSEKWQRSQRAEQQRGKTLQDTGGLAASIKSYTKSTGGVEINVVDNALNVNVNGYFDIQVGSNKKVEKYPLAAIHHFGGRWQVPVTDRMRRFFWYMHKRTKDDKYKAMALSKKTRFTITMPARPIFVLQDEDLDLIKEKYGEWLGKLLK